ncbi:efflux RND transporter periplasmic adaptor subunit [Caenispirillum bisanense]|uniref:RND family efflux transporter, MFP subunit n=1 Tax=Caenispirillum bisanense TaxID=414052 RepID=A0A286GX67_9PROT|nr:efflux RND transporter periplasmic adaptor subunit [Caenispirillum bisanense]SOE00093.1 RND family efflux transporter, MFP subunit [Caenispirillum bisanense]
MREFLRTHWRKALVLPPVLIAAGALVLAVQTRQPPTRAAETEMVRAVRVIAAPALDVVPKATGFGTVEPARVWQAVAEVSGRVVALHPELERGQVLAAGTELIRFDPADYELALARLDAQLAELDAREQSTRDSLAIEERSVAVLRRDLARKRDLRTSGAAAATAVDTAERALLAGEQQVQSLRTTLALLPAQRKALQAQADTASLDLARTVVRAPFDMRVTTVNVQEGQYAQRGTTLASGDGIATAEVAAQVPLAHLFPLIRRADQPLGADVATVSTRMAEVSGLRPVVRLRAGERVVEWPAEVSRIAEEVDPKTRTVGVIVSVADPYRTAQPGVRPPLTRGMFVEVALSGAPHEGKIVVPRHALHQGPAVYVATADDRLEIRPVTVAWQQGDIAVLAGGVAPGERVVVSDVIPAIAGLKLAVTPDPDALAAVTAAAGAAP